MFRRTFVILIIFALTPLVIFTSAYYAYHSVKLNDDIENDLNRRLKNIDYIIQYIISDKASEVLSWSKMSLPEVCYEYDRPEAMEMFLNELMANYKSYAHIIAYKNDLSIFASDTNSLPQKKDFETANILLSNVLKDERVSHVQFLHADNHSYIVISAPVLNTLNEVLGFIAAYIEWDNINEFAHKYESKSVIAPYIDVEELYYDGNYVPLNVRSGSVGAIEAAKASVINGGSHSSYSSNVGSYVLTCTVNSTLFYNEKLVECIQINKHGMLSSLHLFRNIAVIIALASSVVIALTSLLITKKILAPFRDIVNILTSYKSETDNHKTSHEPSDADIDGLKGEIFNLISQVIHSEKQLRANEHLAAIGRTSAMVAHDIRKPFANMKSLLTMLPEKKDDPNFVRYASGQVNDSIRKAESMLGDILEYSKETKIEKDDVGVVKLITAAIGDVFKNVGELDIHIEYDLKHVHCINADEVKVTRVFANIIDNAVAAMGGQGRIDISTCDYMDESGSRWVSIVIANNGPKISDEVMPHLFEPFYTRGKRSGTGLGLAICHKIVAAHGGTISAASEEGKTSFTINLPSGVKNEHIDEGDLLRHSRDITDLMPVEPKHRSISEDLNQFLQLHKTRDDESYLLIVDDEPLFRETIRSLINRIPELRDNLKVIEADSAEVALKQFEARQFDYVISDIDMGRFNMNGYEFVGVVLSRYPRALVMIHSNKRMQEKDAALAQRNNFQGFLPKPMDEAELAHFLAGKVFEQKSNYQPSAFSSQQNQKQCQSVEVSMCRSERQTAESGERKAQKHVLIINDEDFIRSAIKIQVKRKGDIQVLEAHGVSDAIKILEQESVDVVLADIDLNSREDGYDVLKKVRSDKRPIKFYMMSGMSKDDEWPKARELGADGYIQMPYDEEDLGKVLS